jgi:hypothetical protein
MWFKLLVRDSAFKITHQLHHTHINLRHVQKIVYTPKVLLKIAFHTGDTVRLTNQEYSSDELDAVYKQVQHLIETKE